jgi:hypothetical protein
MLRVYPLGGGKGKSHVFYRWVPRGVLGFAVLWVWRLGFPAHLEPPIYTACVLKGVLRFFNILLLIKKKNMDKGGHPWQPNWLVKSSRRPSNWLMASRRLTLADIDGCWDCNWVQDLAFHSRIAAKSGERGARICTLWLDCWSLAPPLLDLLAGFGSARDLAPTPGPSPD